MSQSGDGVRRTVSISVQLVDENDRCLEPISQVFTLKGPGEVVGFIPDMRARTEPQNGANDFEPNYFPFIEFDDPDYPWRYFIQDAGGARLLPWIVLVVLKKDEFKDGPRSSPEFPSIVVKKNAAQNIPLPDLRQSWAWAHVQLAGAIPRRDEISDDEKYKEAIGAYIAENPELNCSRLMCLRKLEPLTEYYAFVVPTSNMGRLAGLDSFSAGLKNDLWDKDSDNGTAAARDIELPVYRKWYFQTSEPGDFEKLIDIIQYKDVPFDAQNNCLVGIRPIDGSNPGFLTTPLKFPDDTFKLEGALVPRGFFGENHDANEKPAETRKA